jgi:DNA-binding transcriptional LysR family regulator
LSLISAHTIDAELAAGRVAVLDVAGLPLMRKWYLVRRANWTPTPVGSAIWDFASARAAEFMPAFAGQRVLALS